MGHSQEFDDLAKIFSELFVILEKFQSLVFPLYGSLCSPQLVQDIAEGTEGIVSKWATTYDMLKMVDRCIQEMGTKIGNVACRINFDNLHHIETDVLEGIRKRFASEFRLLSFVSDEVHSHHAQWNVIMDPIFKIAHDLDLNKIYAISEALTQCLASMESHFLQKLYPNRVPYYSGSSVISESKHSTLGKETTEMNQQLDSYHYPVTKTENKKQSGELSETPNNTIGTYQNSAPGQAAVEFQEPVGNRGMVKDFATALLDELERLGADVTEHHRRLGQNSAVPQIDVCQPTITEPHGMRQDSEAVVEQDGSHLSPKITLGQLSECPPQVETCQHSVPETVNDKHGSKTVITQVRLNSNLPITPGQHVECPQKEMQCKSKCMKTEKLGQNTVKPHHPELNKTNYKLKSYKGHRTHKSKKKKWSAQHKSKGMRHGQNMVKYKSPQMPKTKFRAQLQKVKIEKPKKTNKKKKSNTNQILVAKLPNHKIIDHSLTSNISSFTDILFLPFRLFPKRPRVKIKYK